MLAGELGIEYYDRDILRMASEESGIYEGLFGMLEEKGKRRRLFRRDGEYRHEKPNTRPESSEFVSDDNLFKFQAQIIKGLAEREENCIMVGRCADYVLEGRENLGAAVHLCRSRNLHQKCHGDVCLEPQRCRAHHRKDG